ncbi:MAG: nucleotide sugar dehydrogenase [Chthoniobacter sp.]|nr:nucleotide sugar dehydrogenase [Chthoniobacter sp.]
MYKDTISTAPDGTTWRVPEAAERAAEFAEIARRAAGRRVVVVQGLGFVGSAVAAVVAAARDAAGQPRYFVIGVDLPTPAGYWKIAKLNEGLVPFASPDAEFDRLVHEGVNESHNLSATSVEEAYSLAETIVIDVQLDVIDRTERDAADIAINLGSLEAAARTIGRNMRPDALVLVETTVPFGTCERVLLPVLREERAKRGITEPLLLAHAYERVMPGPRYVDSIRRFWRTFAGIDATSTARTREFLDSFTDTASFPACELGDIASSELAKILENSFRAANIAFIHEWTLLAEKAGINLWSVVDSIRVRKGTHDNLRYPGFGVGGYCLTKDSLLAQWSLAHLYQIDHRLDVTIEALRINHEMPLHTLNLLRELAGGTLRGRKVLVCGVSYLSDVGDTRHSPAEIFVDALAAEGAQIVCHDPCVAVWPERPAVALTQDLTAAITSAEAIVFAIPHSAYRRLALADWPQPRLIVDANNVISDETAASLHRAGSRLLGVGKGHWRKGGFHS